MRRTGALLATTTLLGAALAVAPGAAAAPPRASVVPCGAVLTASVRLAADVLCPTANGIVLAADGVELNLNGHRLVGGGAGTGVFVTARGTTVRNGVVSGWNTDVGAAENDADTDAPPEFSATVRDTRVENSRIGVAVRPGALITVRDSVLRRNGRGATSEFGGRVRIESSTLERNTTGAWSFGTVADGMVVRDSLIRDNSFAGVSCGQDGAYDVAGSTLLRNGYGLEVFECLGRVVDSAFVWNREHVGGYLARGDRIDLICNSYTRDGGPVPFPVQPCPAGRTAPAITGAE